MSDLTFKVEAKSENPTKTVVGASGFSLIIDEPEGLGGTNAGPNPVEFVSAALAGCLNVVGHLVAGEMGFTIENLSFSIEGCLNPACFTGESDAERPGYKSLQVDVSVDSDADRETLEEWLAVIESRCPVSDNIAHETPVTIRLA